MYYTHKKTRLKFLLKSQKLIIMNCAVEQQKTGLIWREGELKNLPTIIKIVMYLMTVC